VQAAFAASLLQHVTKLVVARQRPYAHYAPPGTLVSSEEDDVSFWSGHTSLGFALAVSSGTVASTRGYALAPVIWAGGLALAAATGYLRIAADRHYATDVLTGAAIGSLVGYAWPKLVHPHLRRDLEIVPTGPGVAVLGRF
jgi:membrane-associated phospholipid phosphatase